MEGSCEGEEQREIGRGGCNQDTLYICVKFSKNK